MNSRGLAILMLIGVSVGAGVVGTCGKQRGGSPSVHLALAPSQHSGGLAADPNAVAHRISMSSYADSVQWSDGPMPTEYRGTPLEWHLRKGATSEEVAAYLGRLPSLGARDYQAVLREAARRRDPTLATSLVAARSALRDDPYGMSAYASALLGIADASGAGLRASESDAFSLRVLAAEVLAAQVAGFRPSLHRSQWRSLASNMEAILSSPEMIEPPNALRKSLDLLSEHCAAALDDLAKISKRGGETPEGPIHLARVLNTDVTVAAMLRLLARWDREEDVRQNLASLEVIATTIIGRAKPAECRVLAQWALERRHESRAADDELATVLRAIAIESLSIESLGDEVWERIAASDVQLHSAVAQRRRARPSGSAISNGASPQEDR